jgi:hypothetical protein
LLRDIETMWLCKEALTATTPSWSSAAGAAAVQRPEVVDLLGRRVLGGQPCGFRFEQGSRGEKLIGLVFGGHVHKCAESGAQVHPSLSLHALQRFPHGLPTDPQLRCQIVFYQVLTRLQLRSDDHLDEGVVNRLAQRCRTLYGWRPGPRGRCG